MPAGGKEKNGKKGKSFEEQPPKPDPVFEPEPGRRTPPKRSHVEPWDANQPPATTEPPRRSTNGSDAGIEV